jgi:TolA-binding protein
MAGRSAFARQGYKDAKPYFQWLIANGPPAVTNSLVPTELVARAYFALGDCFLLDPEQRDDKLVDAMTAFRRIIDNFPESREALLARGRLANCHLVRANLDPAQTADSYTNATQLYLEVLTPAAGADIASRSEAEIGLATVLEKRGLAASPGPDRDELFKQSLGHLLRVFHAGNLNPGETTSLFWLNRAGNEAARLAEVMGLREQAAGLYEMLAKTFPAAAAAFEQRATQLRTPR